MKIKLEINIGNDAVQTYNDIFTILAEHAHGISMGDFGNPFQAPVVTEGRMLRDDNGNTVGQWEIVE